MRIGWFGLERKRIDLRLRKIEIWRCMFQTRYGTDDQDHRTLTRVCRRGCTPSPMDWCSSCDTYACHGKDPCHRDGRSHMWDMSYPPKVDMCIYVCAPPLLNDRLARVWCALIGAPFRIKVMDTRARVQMQVLYPWDPLVCAVADMVTRAQDTYTT